MVVHMRKHSTEARALVLSALVKGAGVNATASKAGVSQLTVLRLLTDAGMLALDYQVLIVQRLPTACMEVDKLWSFVGCKEMTKRAESGATGALGVWVAVDSDHEPCISYLAGERGLENARLFVQDVASRLIRRAQPTSDGHSAYPEAVEAAFGGKVDYQPAKQRPRKAHRRPHIRGRRRTNSNGNIGKSAWQNLLASPSPALVTPRRVSSSPARRPTVAPPPRRRSASRRAVTATPGAARRSSAYWRSLVTLTMA